LEILDVLTLVAALRRGSARSASNPRPSARRNDFPICTFVGCVVSLNTIDRPSCIRNPTSQPHGQRRYGWEESLEVCVDKFEELAEIVGDHVHIVVELLGHPVVHVDEDNL